MNVEAILRAKGGYVATLTGTATLADAAASLRRLNIGALVVLDRDGKLAGIVSERDIVGALDRFDSSASEVPVSDVMTRDVRTCGQRDSIEDLMTLMTERRIRHLPVLQDGRLCGIVSIGDVVKSRLEQIQFEAGELRRYVATAG